MLRFASVGDPEAYFTQHLAKGDYYINGQEESGIWRGKAANMLGLEGEVTRKDFAKLCQNRRPDTGEKLTPRDSKTRRVGVDLSFHCPKSISLLYGISGDEQIKDSVQTAVQKTMYEVERDAQVRVRKGKEKNADVDRRTGNLVWGEFIHKTARPVNGIADPHLHVHCYVFNASYDETERRFKAAQLGTIRRDANYYEACFHNHLADELCRQGYEITRTKKGWELAGIDRETLEKFSARTKQIDEKARILEEKIGRDLTAKERDGLAAQTRSRKAKEIPYPELQQKWAQRLSEPEQEAIIALYEDRDPMRYQNQQTERYAAGADSIDHAFDHCLERRSVVRERELMTVALKQGIGFTSQRIIEKALDEHESVIRGRDGQDQKLVTTLEVKAEEEAMLTFARKGRGGDQVLNADPDYTFQYDFLNTQQRAAVTHVITTEDRVSIIQGKAGVGKTTTIKEAAHAIQKGGHQVYTFAPTAEATKLLQEDGFEKAATVSRLLVDEQIQKEIKGQVIWIDEAGLVSGRMMSKVFAIAQQQKARVVLSGDTRQHHSVERGDAMRLLVEQAGLPIVDIDQIQRQKGTYREAIEAVSRGDVDGAFEKLDSLDWIQEIEDDRERSTSLAQDYVTAVTTGRTALVVSPTHREKDKITKKIREQLREVGILQGEEATLTRQRNLNWTEAERREVRNYEAGLQIQFIQNCPGIKRGERFSVIAHEHEERDKLWVRRSTGEEIALPLVNADRFQVYREVGLPLAKGDKLTITQNGFAQDEDGKRKRLINGMIYQVRGISEDGNIHLHNGWIIDRSFGHIDHGYCTTSYKAQGKTVDQVFLAQSVESNPAASREQFYVSVSRARRSVTVYTDNKEELKRAVYNSQERLSALEMTEQQTRRELRDAFQDNASSVTEQIETPEAEKLGPIPQKKDGPAEEPFERQDWDKLLEEQKEDITEAERLTRDAGGKSQASSVDGAGLSETEKRKKKRITANTLVGLMSQYMNQSEVEQQELRENVRARLREDERKRLEQEFTVRWKRIKDAKIRDREERSSGLDFDDD